MSYQRPLTHFFNGGPNSALLVIDMLSDFEFEDGEKLFENTMKIAGNIRDLRSRARVIGMPVIYVNDNYGKWNEDFRSYIATLKQGSEKGRTMLETLEPSDDDYFILKPQRSGFYATALGVLLMSLNVSNVVLTGVTTDICVLFTAHDAYMRGFRVHVPENCCTAVEPEHHRTAIELLKRVTDANTTPWESSELFDEAKNGKHLVEAVSDGREERVRNEFRLNA